MQSKKILEIEDDPFITGLISTKLISVGYTLFTAMNGASGFALAQKEKPDLILLDLMLPDMSGFEVLKHLKADRTTQLIPVIILSNLGGREEIEKGMSLGASSYLIKSNLLPHEVAEMIEIQFSLHNNK